MYRDNNSFSWTLSTHDLEVEICSKKKKKGGVNQSLLRLECRQPTRLICQLDNIQSVSETEFLYRPCHFGVTLSWKTDFLHHHHNHHTPSSGSFVASERI